MRISKIKLDFLDTNCYIIETQKLSFIIDPGSDFEKINNFLLSNNIIPNFIINTHCHFDHIGAVIPLIEFYNTPFYIHEKEEEILNDSSKNLSSFFNGNELSFKTYKLIKGEIIIDFLLSKIDIFHMPGHSPGSIVIKYENFLFTGDVIFKGNIGRTDLPGGDKNLMKLSLKKLKSFDENLLIFPGHGPESTLKEEIENNYFLKNLCL